MKCFLGVDDQISESTIKAFVQLIKGTRKEGKLLTKVKGETHPRREVSSNK